MTKTTIYDMTTSTSGHASSPGFYASTTNDCLR